jgi:hypothetical protein
VDSQRQCLDTPKHNYVIRFPGAVLPPVDAFCRSPCATV